MGNSRKLLSAGLALAIMSSASFAADMTMPEVPVAGPIEGVLYDWNGAYIGVSGGYVDPNIGIGFGGTDIDYGSGNYLIGGTVGYNFQMDNIVVGIEGDLSYANVDDKFSDPFGFGFDGNTEIEYFGTVRGRVGYAFDNFLVFGTGGIAFTGVDVNTAAGNISDNLTGYTVGGGLEYGFSENVTAKVEYLYADFGKENTLLFPGNVRTDLDMNIVRVGLNFKF